MNAIETLNAYCEAQGYSPVGDPGLLLEVLDEARILEEESSSRRWWNDLYRVVEVDGVLYRYAGAETTGDETPSEKGWEFDPSSIGFVKATKSVELVTKFKFEKSDEPFSVANDDHLLGGMTFGLAIEAMKMGKKVARAGWNGKGMFLFLVPGSTFKVNRPPLLGIYPEGTEVNYCPHIDMKTADGKVVPWLASQTDMLGEDWMIVE